MQITRQLKTLTLLELHAAGWRTLANRREAGQQTPFSAGRPNSGDVDKPSSGVDQSQWRSRDSLPITAEEALLDELAREVVAELRAAHRGRQIELGARGNLRGRWDPGRIAQLLSNLAANALSHGAREYPVTVALDGEGETVRLSVSNRGPVIPPELVERLFEPFQQGTDSRTRRRGLGLGLFIVREIVRAHGGSIDVRSLEDLTTFVVTLPRTSSSSPADEPPGALAAATTASGELAPERGS